MAKIEVEHRGLLDRKRFSEINKFLKRNGKFLGEKDRFSIIYLVHGGKVNFYLIEGDRIDLRLRITNKKSELVLKYGKWGGKDARKEFLFSFDSKKFDEMVEFLKILGFYYGFFNATKTYLYLYEGIEFALVKVPDLGYYFEAEINVNPESVASADSKIISACKGLDLSVLNYKDFVKLCESLNKRPGFKFNFKKQKFSDIRKRFANYF